MKRSTRRSKSPSSKGARLSSSSELEDLMESMTLKQKRSPKGEKSRKKRRATRNMRIIGSQFPNSALPAFVLPVPAVPEPMPDPKPIRLEGESLVDFRRRKAAFMEEKTKARLSSF
jgi:hypothetical protein